MYNYTFTLGDPSCDGHGCTKEYHIFSSHDASEITKAYVEFSQDFDFKYLKEVGAEYECFGGIPKDITNTLFELGILEDKDRIIHFDETGEKYKGDRYGYSKDYDLRYDGCYEFDYCKEDFLDIFFKIIKYKIPNFEWYPRDLDESHLTILDGAGYGLVSYP